MRYVSRLYAGKVYHRRRRPRQHQLQYSVFTLLLELNEIDTLARELWLFSRNRFNLFSFYDTDFGEQRRETLSEYIERKLIAADIRTQPAQVYLSCYPRVLGYTFNPLSLFYCLDSNGQCFAVVYEVHNTFGERHSYVLAVDAVPAIPGDWIHQVSEKQLFVSPFAHMDMQYEFRLNLPDQRQVIVIRACDAEGLVITASYTAKLQELNAARLFKYLFVYPLQGVKIIMGIHWEALLLWCKGLPWFKHQTKKSVY